MRQFLYVFTLIIISLVGCTSNPLGDDSISLGQRQMSGRVQLENQHTPEGVYVWLEGFNLGALTASDGSFSLTLSPDPGEGISGLFRVYFFVANYLLDFVEVAVRSGEFVYGDAALNASGELSEAVQLRQFLAVSVNAAPETVTRVNNINVTMTFSLDLQALIDTSTVVLPNTTPGFLSSVFFENTETNELWIFQGQPVSTREVILVGSIKVTRSMDVAFTRINLPIGSYRFIPYILVSHQQIPEELLNSIGVNVGAFGPNYLKLPFKREGGDFEIKE